MRRWKPSGAETKDSEARDEPARPALLETRQNDGIPKYVQLAAIIKDKIIGKEYAANQQIPTEEQLCQEYQVSRITVREAVNRLVQDHLLTRKQGKGTYVVPQKLRRDIAKVYSFTHDMEQLGLKPSSTVLDQRVEVADAELRARLKLSESDGRVTRIRRLRKANDAPILLETTILPVYLCPRLVEADLENQSLYRILTEEYGLFPYTAEETYEPVILQTADAKLLECRPRRPQPAFAIERIAYLENGTPIEYTRSLARGDRMTLGITMLADKADFQRRVGV